MSIYTHTEDTSWWQVRKMKSPDGKDSALYSPVVKRLTAKTWSCQHEQEGTFRNEDYVMNLLSVNSLS